MTSLPISTDDRTVANLRVWPTVLASGIDALYLSGHGYLSKDLTDHLDEVRRHADQEHKRIPFILGELIFALEPHGWGKYRYCLEHANGRIGFTTSERLPTVRIQPRAEFLHSSGPEGAVRFFRELLSPVVDGLALSVSRLDVFCDIEGMELSSDDRQRFVCRADGSTTYEVGGVVTGFTFGSRRTQRISARLYDKTAEITAKGGDWWELVWGERHRPGATVWRIEFEIGRGALRELDLSRPADVLAAAPSLWQYCTTEWLTLRRPCSDSNRSRWPIDPRWTLASSAALIQPTTKLLWIRRRKRASSLRRLLPGLLGYLVAFAVLAGTVDLSGTLDALRVSVADDEVIRRMTFAERVRRRRAEGEYR
jgi:hypothetical protein